MSTNSILDNLPGRDPREWTEEEWLDAFERIRIGDVSGRSHVLCAGGPWLLFGGHDRGIASRTLRDSAGVHLRHGRWPGDEALTQAATDLVPVWLLSGGFSRLHRARDAAISAAQASMEVASWTCLPKPMEAAKIGPSNVRSHVRVVLEAIGP